MQEMAFDFYSHPLTSKLINVKSAGPNKWHASCPCGRNHKNADKNESLSVEYDQDKEALLVYCFTGCSVTEICQETGCSVADLFIGKNPAGFISWFAEKNGLTFVESYSYCYGPYNDGLRKVRFRQPDGSKDFRWIHEDDTKKSGFAMRHSGKHRLYVAGNINNDSVFVVEGEKDANTVYNLINKTAVSAENGASRKTGGKWLEEYNQQLTGKTVYIIWDNDEIGKKFALIEAQQIAQTAAAVFLLDLPQAWPGCPEKADITDYVKAVGPEEAAQTLAELISSAEEYTAPEQPAKVDDCGRAYDWDDMITEDYEQSARIEYVDPETGEIVGADPAALGADQEQPIPGKTVITAPAANQNTKEDKKKNPFTVSTYADVEIKETDYLFFPWFPRGKLVAIQGDSGTSKSTFMYAIGAKVTTGADLLGVPCEDPGNVMFITNEDDESDILTAFIDAGGDVSRLFRIREREKIAMLRLSDSGAGMLNKIIKEFNIRLLVLDPIQSFLQGDMNKANETRPQLARLMDIAAENNNCIAFIEHTGKDTTKSALHRGIGSVDIGAATRSILQIVTDPEDHYYKIAYTVKNNTASMQDTNRAIRYQVKDRPGSHDIVTGRHHHFHGHAEFAEILTEYNERSFRRAQRKEEEGSLQAEINYETEPLVITVRKLIEQNPGGLFIGTTELIRRITICAGHCPYSQTQNKHNGINSKISALRSLVMENDAIQLDIERDPTTTKPFFWDGQIIAPEKQRERGVYINPIHNGSGGAQQTRV